MPNLWDAVFSWKNIIRAMSEGHPVLILMARLINYICTLSMLLSLCWALTAESSLIGYTWLSLINDDPCQAKRWNKVKCMCFSWQPLSFHKDFYIKFSSKGVCSFFRQSRELHPYSLSFSVLSHLRFFHVPLQHLFLHFFIFFALLLSLILFPPLLLFFFLLNFVSFYLFL